MIANRTCHREARTVAPGDPRDCFVTPPLAMTTRFDVIARCEQARRGDPGEPRDCFVTLLLAMTRRFVSARGGKHARRSNPGMPGIALPHRSSQ